MADPLDLATVLRAGRPQPDAGWLEAAHGTTTVGRRRAAYVAEAWQGTPVGDHCVGLVAPDPVAFATLFVALVAAGATVVPLDPRAPGPANRDLLDRAGADAVLTVGADSGDLGHPVHLVGEELLPPELDLEPPGGAAEGGVLLFSSGSTGPLAFASSSTALRGPCAR